MVAEEVGIVFADRDSCPVVVFQFICLDAMMQSANHRDGRQARMLLHHGPVDVGEAVVAALEAVGEAGVVEAEQMQGGGVQVVDVDGILDDVVAEVVRLAVDVAAFHARAGHPDAEAARVMVAPVSCRA